VHWERIAAIAGAGALVVALATWWLPNPGKTVCGLIGNKGSWCSDVPDAYLGQWKGIRTMENVLGIMPPSVKTTEDTLTIKPGNLQSNVAETGGVGKTADGKEAGCFQTWQLTTVSKDSLTFHVAEAHINDPKVLGSAEGCPTDLTVSAKLIDQNTLDVTELTGPQTFPALLPPGTVVSRGPFHRT
jgi:hypothetical protein